MASNRFWEKYVLPSPTLRDGLQFRKNWDPHEQCSGCSLPLNFLDSGSSGKFEEQGSFFFGHYFRSDLVKPYLVTEASICTDSLLFCAPEALALSKWRTALTNPAVFERIVAVVIDEAHCVSKW